MPATFKQKPSPDTFGVEPSKPKPTAGTGRMLSHQPTPYFMWMFHPAKWGVFETADGKELLPQHGTLRVEPGVNGVTGSGNYEAAITHHQRNGYIVLEPTDPRLMEFLGEGYIDAWPVEGGTLHTTIWETPKMAGGRAITKTNYEGLHDFLRWVARNILPTPEPELLEHIRGVHEARKVRQLEASQRNPAKAADIVATDEAIETIDRAIAETEVADEPADEPKPQKGKGKAVKDG